MKTRSIAFLAITIMITLLTNRCSTKNNLLWQKIFMMFLSVPRLLKLLANIFLSHRYIYLVICRLQCTWTPYYKIENKKNITKKNASSFQENSFGFRILLPLRNCSDLLHGNCLLTGFNFSIKILLAKITFLFWILLCYLFNMSSVCIGSISWCCFVVTLFRCSSHVPLFRCIPIVLPVFPCSTGIPCSAFRCSVFGCSWFYSMSSKLHFSQTCDFAIQYTGPNFLTLKVAIYLKKMTYKRNSLKTFMRNL